MICERCGGPLSARAGQTVIGPTVTVTTGDGELVDYETSSGGWCGDCVDEMNEAMGVSARRPPGV